MQITRVDPLDVDLDLADRLAAVGRRLARPRRARDPPAHRAGAAHLLPARQRRATRSTALWVARATATTRSAGCSPTCPGGTTWRWPGCAGSSTRTTGAAASAVGCSTRRSASPPSRAGPPSTPARSSAPTASRFLERPRVHQPRASTSTRSGASTCTRAPAGTGCTTRPPRRPPTTSWCTSSAPRPTTCSTGWSRCTRRSTTRPPTRASEPARVGRRPGAARTTSAMTQRRQTTYRVLARHVPTGEWAGMSLLCVDEFSPSVAAQEDTSVVRAHRGHRLGLLMKTDMVRWLADAAPGGGRDRDLERHRQPPHDRRQRAARLPGGRSAGRATGACCDVRPPFPRPTPPGNGST